MAREVITGAEQTATLQEPFVPNQRPCNSCEVKREMSTLSVHIRAA